MQKFVDAAVEAELELSQEFERRSRDASIHTTNKILNKFAKEAKERADELAELLEFMKTIKNIKNQE